MKRGYHKPRRTISDCYTEQLETADPLSDSASFLISEYPGGFKVVGPYLFQLTKEKVQDPFTPSTLSKSLKSIRDLLTTHCAKDAYKLYTELQDQILDAYEKLIGWRQRPFKDFIDEHSDEHSYLAEVPPQPGGKQTVLFILIINFAEAAGYVKPPTPGQKTTYVDPFEQEGSIAESTQLSSNAAKQGVRPTVANITVFQKSKDLYAPGSYAQFEIFWQLDNISLEGYNSQVYTKMPLSEAYEKVRQTIHTFSHTATVSITTTGDFLATCKEAFMEVLNARSDRSNQMSCDVGEFLEIFGGATCLVYTQQSATLQPCTVARLEIYVEEGGTSREGTNAYKDPFEQEGAAVSEASYTSPPSVGIVQGKNVNSFGPNPTGFKGSPFGQEVLVNFKVTVPKGKQSSRRLKLRKRNSLGSKRSSVSRKV